MCTLFSLVFDCLLGRASHAQASYEHCCTSSNPWIFLLICKWKFPLFSFFFSGSNVNPKSWLLSSQRLSLLINAAFQSTWIQRWVLQTTPRSPVSRASKGWITQSLQHIISRDFQSTHRLLYTKPYVPSSQMGWGTDKFTSCHLYPSRLKHWP